MNTKLQQCRKAVQLLSLLVFPATFYYFSPVIPLMGAYHGIVSGGLVLFALLFAQSLFLGRGFCAWLCPGGALGDYAASARPRRLPGLFLRIVKFGIWVPWLVVLALLFVRAGGAHRVEVGFATERGFSVTSLHALIMYLFVIGTFYAFSLGIGRRASCHALCWMAPFMMAGRFLSNRLKLSSLRLASDPDACVSCGRCAAVCPMSLPIDILAKEGDPSHRDCILCGECILACRKKSLRFYWGKP